MEFLVAPLKLFRLNVTNIHTLVYVDCLFVEISIPIKKIANLSWNNKKRFKESFIMLPVSHILFTVLCVN